ncbi:hypothetical protein EDD17DRAFT_297395 [Pisolithus thermaeus]|nr:hypothetical protein EV401DRAFT_2060663 [Pisolithus croceorrhizus]KAI6140961.1 hypothetical protein EDD17DRAFT_297395 [Pisolithus thermaeus]
MAPTAARPITKKRNRKRKHRIASSSSDDSSSDDSVSSVQQSNATQKHPQSSTLPAGEDDPSSSSSSSSSPSPSSSSDDDSEADNEVTEKAASPQPDITGPSTKGPTSPARDSPSPPPPSVVATPPLINPGSPEDELVLKEKFRKFWMASLAEGFKDDLEVIRKEPNLGQSRLALLIESLAAGAEVFSSTSTDGNVNEMEVVVDELS